MNDLVPYVEPARMTEREARLAGATSNRLLTTRGALRDGPPTGTFTVKTRSGTASIPITAADTEALLALLIERDEAFLIGLNIEIEK